MRTTLRLLAILAFTGFGSRVIAQTTKPVAKGAKMSAKSEEKMETKKEEAMENGKPRKHKNKMAHGRMTPKGKM